jgi:hypothetical protein
MASQTAGVSRDPDAETQETPVDHTAVRRAIQRRSCEIERRELERARTRLESSGELTAAQYRALADMVTAVSRVILAGPESVIAAGDLDHRSLQQAAESLPRVRSGWRGFVHTVQQFDQ